MFHLSFKQNNKTKLSTTAKILICNAILKDPRLVNRPMMGIFWFALLSPGDEVLANDWIPCWQHVTNVKALTIPIKGTTATEVIRNIILNLNKRVKVVYITSPSADGRFWSIRQIVALARLLPSQVVLVLDLSNTYCLTFDIFTITKEIILESNVVVIPQLHKIWSLINNDCGNNKLSFSINRTFNVNKFIPKQVRNAELIEIINRKAAFSLFWAVKMTCKLFNRNRIICTFRSNEIVLRFVKIMPLRLIQERLTKYCSLITFGCQMIRISLPCSYLCETLISALYGLWKIKLTKEAKLLQNQRFRRRTWMFSSAEKKSIPAKVDVIQLPYQNSVTK